MVIALRIFFISLLITPNVLFINSALARNIENINLQNHSSWIPAFAGMTEQTKTTKISSRPPCQGCSVAGDVLVADSKTDQQIKLNHDKATRTTAADWQDKLTKEITTLSKATGAESGIYYKDLNSDLVFQYNAEKRYYLASIVKLFIMIEAFKQLEKGKFSLAEEFLLKKSIYRDGAGRLNWLAVNSKVSGHKVLREMIVKSDNTAADILFKRLGADNINRTIKDLKLKSAGEVTSMVKVRQEVYRRIHPHGVFLEANDFMRLWKRKKAANKLQLFAKLIGQPNKKFKREDYYRAFIEYYKSGMNSMALDDLGKVFEMLAKKKIVSASASSSMLKLLAQCKTGKSRIRAGLNKKWKFAHKTGTQHQRICDAGIITKENQNQAILAICLEKFTSRRRAETLMAKITKTIFSYLPQQNIKKIALEDGFMEIDYDEEEPAKEEPSN